MRARRQNVPVQSHTVARIGGLDHLHQQNNIFGVSSPSIQQQSLPTSLDFASTVDLTTVENRTPTDYLTPPPNGDFRFQNYQSTAGVAEAVTMTRVEPHQLQQQNRAVVQAPPPPPLVSLTSASTTAVQTSPFTPNVGGGFSTAQAQPPLTSLNSQTVQTSSPSNQVQSLTFANQPLEQFTPYSPTLIHEPTNHHHQSNHLNQQQQQQQSQQPNGGGRWELGFDASDILTPPFAGVPEQPGGGGGHQDFGQETASSVRSNKQYLGGGVFFGGSGGGFDGPVVSNNKFTPLDAAVRTSSNNNVYWGTPKTAQQQPIRPSPSFAETNAFRFNNNHHHNNHHNHQYLDSFQMPFTGQFDGPLSQGTVADHVVHTSFRIKRQARNEAPKKEAVEKQEMTNNDDDDDNVSNDHFGDQKPVYSYVKTDRNGNFKWSVRHGY